ncbi:MAG: nucleoside kinase [Treponema sp.]
MFFVSFPNGKNLECKTPVKCLDLLDYFEKDESSIVALKVNNEVFSLNRIIDVDAKVKPIFLNTREGAEIYRRTLCLLLAAASKSLYPKLRLLISHSLGFTYFYTFEGENAEKINLTDIENKMREMVALNLPISTYWLSYEKALSDFSNSNQPDTYKLIEHTSKPKIMVNRLGDYQDLYFQPVMPSIGELKVFELKAYHDGFLLRFPSPKTPNEIPPFEDIPHLFEIYKESKTWGRLVGVSSVGELNDLILSGKVKDYVEISEIRQNNTLARIANEILMKKTVKVILIAGPSSSGKTTTAKKLSMQLKVLGINPVVISLDDFYLGKEKAPKDEKGNPDFECLHALDVELLNKLLLELMEGKTVEMPSYDFRVSARREVGKPLSISSNDILILEGIHALNDELTYKLPQSTKFKIYLSALTQLNLDDHNRIPTSDNRLLRRIVRDAKFRGTSADYTIAMWANVRKGEAKYIFPFQGTADAMFNTALDYELAVLKIYAEPLLKGVKPTDKGYNEASRLLTFLNNFSSMPSSFVHGQSILREFIGNSEFSYD